MSPMGSVLLQVAPWIKTLLVVVLLSLALIQVVRQGPPARWRGEAVSKDEQLSRLLGMTGHVLTSLRPVGMCEFDGCRVECSAEGEYVQKGTTVIVIHVEGMQPIVRAADET